jgi:hypothetical protein
MNYMNCINYVKKSARILVEASDGNPAITVATILLLIFVFNLFECVVENLIFGESFVHFLDLLFTAAFITYTLYAIRECAEYNKTKERDLRKW